MRLVDAARWPVWALIREARVSAGLTQSELARRAGTSQPAVARYERAQALPDLPTLERLLEVCGKRLELVMREPAVELLSSTALARSVEDRLRTNDDYTALVASLRRG